MVKFVEMKLPRLRINSKKPDGPIKVEEIKEPPHVGEIIHEPEPESDFQIALRAVSEKIRQPINGFVDDLLTKWEEERFGEPRINYTEENTLDLTFSYLLTRNPHIDPADPTKTVYTPNLDLFAECIFGQRTFCLDISKLLEDEFGATLFREDLISLIAGEFADAYMIGTMGGISPDFEVDHLYE